MGMAIVLEGSVPAAWFVCSPCGRYAATKQSTFWRDYDTVPCVGEIREPVKLETGKGAAARVTRQIKWSSFRCQDSAHDTRSTVADQVAFIEFQVIWSMNERGDHDHGVHRGAH